MSIWINGSYTLRPAHFLDKEGDFRKGDAFLLFSNVTLMIITKKCERKNLVDDIPWFVSGLRVCVGDVWPG